MNLISYVLFGSKAVYWRAIPFNIMANSVFYPGFRIRLYAADDARSMPIYPFLESAARDHLIELVPIRGPYMGTTPSVWRMMPLWDPEVDILLTRDLDSVPRTDEVRADRVFMASEFCIHGIRANPQHDVLLMGGLSGFNRPRLIRRMGILSYESYASANRRFLKGEKGCDQELLAIHFSQMANAILETRINDTAPIQSGPATLPKEKYSNVDLADVPQPVQDLCDRLTPFPGAYYHLADEDLKEMLQENTPVGERVLRCLMDTGVGRYYGVQG